MAQYCRYCSALVVGDVAYCTTKEKEIPEHLAKQQITARTMISTL